MYKFSGKISILKRIGSKFNSKKLIEAIRFFNYYNNFQIMITNGDIGATTLLSFLLTFIIVNLILIPFNLSLSMLIALFLAVIVSRKLYYFIINDYKFQYLNSLQYLDLIYQDFLVIKNSTQSIFDAIEFIANSNYPIISKNFQDMIFQINNGIPPEEVLFNYINSVSHQTFKERMLNLLSYDMKTKDKILINQDFSLELTSKYQEYTKQLDTRITILISVNIFLPILTITLFSFYFLINNYLILILLPFHVFLLLIMKKSLLKKEFFILGADDISSKEFDELLILLTLTANYLIMNNSPEISLLKAINKYNGNIKNKLNLIASELIFKNQSIDIIWDNLAGSFQNDQSKILLKLIKRMITKSAYETGKRLKNIIENINLNKKIIRKRTVLLKSQQFKVIILLFVLSALMGLMTNIIPFFSQFFQVIYSGNSYQSISLNYNIMNILPNLITFGLILFITSITITHAIKLKNFIFISIFYLFIYLIIVYLTSYFFF